MSQSSDERRARIERTTGETAVTVALGLDGTGAARLASGVPFLDHMLDQVARHGLLDLDVECRGDTDVGSTWGNARRLVVPMKLVRFVGAAARQLVDFRRR